MANIDFSSFVLNGHREYHLIPGIIPPNACGDLDSKLTASASASSVDQSVKSDLHTFIQAAQQEKKDVARISSQTITCKPITRLPPTPFIYERDENPTADASWQPRIRMLEEAYKFHDYVILSIVPSDPKVHQTWYFKNAPMARAIPCQSHFGIENKNSALPATEQDPSELLREFIKPYQTYTSRLYRPEIDPANLPDNILLLFQGDIEDRTVQMPADLKGRIKTITDSFFEDQHAEQLGITFIEQQSVRRWFLFKD